MLIAMTYGRTIWPTKDVTLIAMTYKTHDLKATSV